MAVFGVSDFRTFGIRFSYTSGSVAMEDCRELLDLNEAVDCATIQLRKAKEIIAKQWKVVQEERCKLDEELEKFEKQKELFERERRVFVAEKEWIRENLSEDQVALCVGGKYLTVSRATLVSQEGTMLAAMFSGRHKLARGPGMFFVPGGFGWWDGKSVGQIYVF